VGRSSPEANQLLMGTRSTDREGFIAAQLAGAKAWGSPGSYNEEELILRANESFDRSFNPSGVSRQLMAIMSSGSRTKALGAVKTPTLVIHGNCDNLVNISGGRRTAEAVPGAKFVEIDGMGHDYPEIFWDQLVGALIAHAKQAGSES
jgi:pimeloyl-ACP methyl ester carboxylesterase